MGDKQHYAPPPPYGFQPQPQVQAPTQVIFTQVPGMSAVGPESSRMTCPSCHATISTRVDKESTTKTHLFAFLFCIFGMCPCALIPYCCDCCKATNHYCPNCGTFLGTYDP